MTTNRRVRFGAFELDAETGELRKGDRTLHLQEKPFQLLLMLLERPGELVGRDELRQRLWGEDVFVDFDHSINVAVNKAREALGDDKERPRYIETLPRRGYRFIAPVAPASDGSGPDRGTSRQDWLAAAAVAIVVGLIVLGVLQFWESKGGDMRPTVFSSLAVLPFENVSGDSGEQYLVDGFTEALITELGKIGSLRVISSQSVMQFRDTVIDIPAIADQLRVDAVVEGTVWRSEGRIRVTAQLVAARPESLLWAESYEEKMADILDLQRAIAAAIAGEVRRQVTSEEKVRFQRRAEVVPEAYNAFLKGRYNWNRLCEAGFRQAVDYFEEAIALDPSFGPAHAWLANSWSMLCWYGFERPEVAFAQAEEAAMAALDTGQDLDAAYVALSAVKYFYWWDLYGAMEDTRRAIELNPGNSLARSWHSWGLAGAGLHEEAIAEILHARDVDPLSVTINATVGIRLYDADRYEEARRQLQHVLDMNPELAPALLFLGMTYEQLGALAKAIATLERSVDLTERASSYVAALGHALALANRRADAVELLAELLWRYETEYVEACQIAAVHVALGQTDEAFLWLEKGYDQRTPWMARLNLDPRFDSVRSDERFTNLLRRMNFPVVR